jgi:hypothetical protein
MPLDSNGWEAAADEPSEYRDLLAFLRNHPTFAFRAGELVNTIAGEYGTAIERERCKVHLETLVELGKVEKRRHAATGQIYYRITSSVGDVEGADRAGEKRRSDEGVAANVDDSATAERATPRPASDGG